MPGFALQTMKILIVESDEFIRILLKDSFWLHDKYQRFDLETAENLADADTILADPERRPGIVFLGLETPRAVGQKKAVVLEENLAFIRKLKAAQPPIKIVAFARTKDASLEAQVRALGVDAYLVKGQVMPRQIVELADAL